MRTVLAWGDGVGVWDELGHGIGAFATSPGFAGAAAVIAAYIASRQVRLTRDADERERRDQRTIDQALQRDRHRDQLWARFTWVVEQADTLKFSTRIEMLEAIHEAAHRVNDTSLERLLDLQLDAIAEHIADDLPPDPAETSDGSTGEDAGGGQ